LDYNLYDLNPEVYHFHVPTLAFSPDGTILAAGIVNVENTGKSFGRVVLWDMEDGQVLLDTSGGSWVYSVSFSADGSYLAVQGGGNVEVFKPEDAIGSTGYPIAFSTENSAYPGSPATIFSPDGRYLAMAAFSIVLYDRTNAYSFFAGLGVNEMHVQSIAFSPDSALLLSGGGDNSLYIWSISNQRMLKTLTGHNSLVTSVSYSQDGTMLASGSWDGTIRLWGVP
jgi:WD40 repeat protein